LVRSGMIRQRVRRQWRVAWAHVRRAPWWVLGAEGLLTVVSVAARALILPGLAWGMPDRPPFAQMFYGALALIHAPLVVPLPSGGGGLEVAFLEGFVGDFGTRQVTMLLLWRFYTAVLLTVLGAYLLVRSLGYRAAVELFKIGWRKTRRVDARAGGSRSTTDLRHVPAGAREHPEHVPHGGAPAEPPADAHRALPHRHE
jgi:hypothetical protein